MIRLSPEQMLAFQDVAMHRFVGRVVDEIPAYRAPLVEGRTRSTLFRAASMAVDHAHAYGLESERALFLYANLAVTLGTHFPNDPALFWAGDILNDHGYLGNEKMDDLWNAYLDYCDAVMGPEEEAYFPAAAYARYRTLAAPPADTGSIAPVVEDLAALWPEKVNAVPEEALHAHIMGAGRRAADLGLNEHHSRVRFCRLAFLLGEAFDADPLHDWFIATLNDKTHPTEATLMDLVEARFAEVVVEPALAWYVAQKEADNVTDASEENDG